MVYSCFLVKPLQGFACAYAYTHRLTPQNKSPEGARYESVVHHLILGFEEVVSGRCFCIIN
jgi:hypothetical protein